MDIKDILKSYAEILAIKIEQLQMLHVGLKTTPIKKIAKSIANIWIIQIFVVILHRESHAGDV